MRGHAAHLGHAAGGAPGRPLQAAPLLRAAVVFHYDVVVGGAEGGRGGPPAAFGRSNGGGSAGGGRTRGGDDFGLGPARQFAHGKPENKLHF
jgi:hypothetical protein